MTELNTNEYRLTKPCPIRLGERALWGLFPIRNGFCIAKGLHRDLTTWWYPGCHKTKVTISLSVDQALECARRCYMAAKFCKRLSLYGNHLLQCWFLQWVILYQLVLPKSCAFVLCIALFIICHFTWIQSSVSERVRCQKPAWRPKESQLVSQEIHTNRIVVTVGSPYP